MTAKITKLVLIPDKSHDAKTKLEEALEDSHEFKAVIIIALLPDELGKDYETIHTYITGLNRLEAGGLLEEAADLVRNRDG